VVLRREINRELSDQETVPLNRRVLRVSVTVTDLPPVLPNAI
jgi:hypothetical protein